MPSRRERAARSAARRMVRTLGEPHKSTLAAGRMPGRVHGAAMQAVGADDGKRPLDPWAILTLGEATTADGWGTDYVAMLSYGLFIEGYMT